MLFFFGLGKFLNGKKFVQRTLLAQKHKHFPPLNVKGKTVKRKAIDTEVKMKRVCVLKLGYSHSEILALAFILS